MGKNYTRQTVNVPDEITELAKQRWELLGFRSFTDYVETLIRADLEHRPLLIKTEAGMCFIPAFRGSEVSMEDSLAAVRAKIFSSPKSHASADVSPGASQAEPKGNRR